MTETPENISHLIVKVLKQEATGADRQALDEWAQTSPQHAAAMEEMLREGYITQGLRELQLAQKHTDEKLIQKGIPVQMEPAPVRRLNTAWFRYAAILLLIAGTAAFLYTSSFRRNPGVSYHHEAILPGSNKAILTLADGSKIELETKDNGKTIEQLAGADILSKAQPLRTDEASTTYNTITTPRGGQYQIVLPDGSKAWLNATSSITFPTAFAQDRKVRITGEVYMEITKDPKKPFEVTTGDLQVQVLDTSFNITAYEDESAISATLITGSVRVLAHAQSAILQPGQQALTRHSGRNAPESNQQAAPRPASTLNVMPADINKTLAWKNGFISFENKPVDQLMRELARWYNIDIVYEKGIPDVKLGGEMSRNVTLPEMITALESIEVHTRLEGRRLIVLSK